MKTFLENYERANSVGDFSALSDLYADQFIFASPNGSQNIKKEDFLKVIPKRKQFFLSIGLKETKLGTFSFSELDEFYIQIKAQWEMTIQIPKGNAVLIVESTYIVENRAGVSRIVLQIDHQDLMAKVNALTES